MFSLQASTAQHRSVLQNQFLSSKPNAELPCTRCVSFETNRSCPRATLRSITPCSIRLVVEIYHARRDSPSLGRQCMLNVPTYAFLALISTTLFKCFRSLFLGDPAPTFPKIVLFPHSVSRPEMLSNTMHLVCFFFIILTCNVQFLNSVLTACTFN